MLNPRRNARIPRGKFVYIVAQFRPKATQSALQGNKITLKDVKNKKEDVKKQ